MKIPDEVKAQITAYGYRKRGNSFWKTENGFYKLINFQTGAYGDYFFINVALQASAKSKRKPMRTAMARRADCGVRECVWMENRILLNRLRGSGPSCRGHAGDRILAEQVGHVRNNPLRRFRQTVAFIFRRSDTLAQTIPAAEKLLRF